MRRSPVLLLRARIDGALETADAARTQGTLAAVVSYTVIAHLIAVRMKDRGWTRGARSRPPRRGFWRLTPAAVRGAVEQIVHRAQFEGRTSCLGPATRRRAVPRRQFEGLLTCAGLGRWSFVGSTRLNPWPSGGGGCFISSGVVWLQVPAAAARRSLQSLPTDPYSQMTTITSTRPAWNSLRATLALLGRRWRRWPCVGPLQLPMRPRPGPGMPADGAARLTVMVS